MRTQASTMDPTPIDHAPSIARYSKELFTIYERMAKTKAHQQFVTICLRDHIIPKGLQLKIRPCVPKSPCREPASRLEKEWARIIRRASRDFLSALKLYHRSCAYHLRRQATNLETFIETCFGKADCRVLRLKAETIHTNWSQRLQQRRVKKFKKLHTPFSTIRQTEFRRPKRRCRQFKRKTPHQLECAVRRSHLQ